MDILKWTGGILIALVLTYACIVAFGAWRWSQYRGKLVSSLKASVVTGGVMRYNAAQIVGLPEPVRRYFARVLTDGQPIVRSARVSMQGTFNMSLAKTQWRPFTSVQHVTTSRPGFVWDARIMMFPGVSVRVTDSYIGGQGKLHPAFLGLFPVGDMEGDGEIARGELMRWFAEGVWYPTGLLPSQGMVWAAVDATSARATMTDGPLSLTLLFRFGADGLVEGIHADARAATVDGVSVMMPWDGTFSDYRRQDGMLIPFQGEVAWITPQGRRPYFQGKVTQLAFDFAA